MKDLVGSKFGTITVLSFSIREKRKYYWNCKCECGKLIKLRSDCLKHIKSCGCKKGWHAIKHGLSKNPLYGVIKGIRHRCRNKKDSHYTNYGKIGIDVCDEWFNNTNSFITWAENNGYMKGLQIDRINNNGNYEPNNCRFVTPRVNTLNRRLITKGNSSGYSGVCFNKNTKKWHSQITIKNNQLYLGSYKTTKKAVIARNNYIIENNLQNDYKIQATN
jgi:hypothetical protein